VSAYLGTKSTKFRNIFIKLSAIRQLQNDHISFLLRRVNQLKLGLGSGVNHVDEKRVFELAQKVDLALEGLFFAHSRKVNFDSIEVAVPAAEVDIGLSSFPEFEVQGIVIDVSKEGIVVLWLHAMYYKRIPTFDPFNSFIKE